jgi:hypothetical protein
MGNTGESIERIEALRALMELLGSPDLTLDEAKALRCRLLDLSGRDEESGPIRGMAPIAASSPIPCERHEHGSRSPGCRECAA